MQICILTNFPLDRQESMLRFGRMLQKGLAARGHVVSTIAPSPIFARVAGSYHYGGWPKYLGYLDKFLLFPRKLRSHLRRESPDVIHIADHANSVYARACDRAKVVVTCHDLMQIQAARGEIPQQRPGFLGRRFQAWILAHIARLPRVACDSRTTAEHLLRLTALPPERVTVIPVALNYPYGPLPQETAWHRVLERWQREPARLARLHSAAGGFMLNVGGGPWYKNRPGLLALFSHLRRKLSPPPVLVMVGEPLSTADAALAQSLGIADEVWSYSDVSNEDLQALYCTAEGLLFPSWHEGFGWPIAEAQACGCPVFTSNRAPMNDVGGESAFYFDPALPEAAAQTIIDSWPLRRERAELGLYEAKRWSLETMLDRYEALYRSLVASRISVS